MATFERTVGVGGDFVDWRLAWNFYRATPAANHTYIFTQISDVNQDATAWNSEQIKDNETIIFRCPFTDSHQGDPTRGFKTVLAADAEMGNVFGIFASGNTLTVDGVYLERTVNNTGPGDMLGFGSNNNTVIYRNLLIRGNGRSIGSGLYDRGISAINHYRPDISIYNCKIWDCGYAMGSPGGTVGGPDGTQVIENVDIYNCERSFTWGSQTPITFRNVVVADPSGALTCWGVLATLANILENCGDTDGSLATANGTVTNPQMNLVATDEFQSLLDTESDFLRLIRGEVEFAITAVPRYGKAPLPVKFTADVEYRSLGSVLGQNGAEPEITGTVDIQGNAIPGDDGIYSIGCHEQQYDWIVPELEG